VTWLNTSVHSGFARSASEAMFPRLFPDAGWWCPSLNPAMGGTRLWDLSRNNWGTLTNMVNDDWLVSGGKLALDFDGVNDYVEFAISAIANRTQLTVSFWGRPRTTASRLELNQATNSTARGGYGFAEDGNAYLVPASVNDYGFCNWSTLGVSQFIHFVGVFDGIRSGNAQRAKIYLNGTERTLSFVGTIPSVTGTFTEPMRLGARVGLTSFSDGQVDDIRIYNRALTATEVSQLWQIGRGNMPLRRRRRYAEQASGFKAYWANRQHLIGSGVY
jgi:hypothetical protein